MKRERDILLVARLIQPSVPKEFSREDIVLAINQLSNISKKKIRKVLRDHKIGVEMDSDKILLIGIGGQTLSGKDTVANYLKDNYGFIQGAFGDNLKFMCMKVFNLTNDQCFTQEGKAELFENPIRFKIGHGCEIIQWLIIENQWEVKHNDVTLLNALIEKGKTFVSPRDVLQFVGTEVCRYCFDPDFHVKVLFSRLDKDHKGKHIVVSDARFENERKIVTEKGGFNLLMDCVQTRDHGSTHASETSLGTKDEYDFVIENDKSVPIENLFIKVKILMQTLMEKKDD